MRGRSRRDENGSNYIRWCFADPHVAAQFVKEFGGAVASWISWAPAEVFTVECLRGVL